MSGKCIFLTSVMIIFLLAPFGNTSAYGEIIKISRLKKGVEEFSYNRDIFSPVPLIPINKADQQYRQVAPPPPPPPPKEEDEDLAEEIRQSVMFEGYIIKDSRSHALLNINGEYFVAAEGDTVAEKIKVVKVTKKHIMVEAESMTIEIMLKGDQNEQ